MSSQDDPSSSVFCLTELKLGAAFVARLTELKLGAALSSVS
jgi:hypothetical protein